MESKELPVHGLAAAGIVRNSSGDILLMKNPRRGWEFPGGMIESGEDLLEGLKREIVEETGVIVSGGELFCVSSNTCSYPGYNGVKIVPPKIILDFICSYESGEPCISDESLETSFVPEKEVLQMITAPVFIERFKAYLEYRGRPLYLSYKNYPQFVMDTKTII